jgi:hypothetical protein
MPDRCGVIYPVGYFLGELLACRLMGYKRSKYQNPSVSAEKSGDLSEQFGVRDSMRLLGVGPHRTHVLTRVFMCSCKNRDASRPRSPC